MGKHHIAPPPWVKPFLPQQGFSTAQVLVTRVGKNLKNPKEPEPMALLYPILQRGTEEELLFPSPYQPPEPLRAPAIPPPRAETQEGGPAQNTRHRRAMSPEGPADSTVALPLRGAGPPMRKETNLINIGPSLLVTYITAEPRMLCSQTTLEI